MVHLFVRLTWQVVASPKCSLNMNSEEKKRRKRGRHEADRGRHEAERKKARGMRFPVGPHS
ncbi:hypothetical protein T11_9916, partial [Trichinella zimbabwensis]